MYTLVLNGSPRPGGDTDALCEAFARSVRGRAETMRAYGADVSPCLDCRACRRTPGCRVHDGMDEIYASLRKGYVDAITGHESALERFVGNAPDMYAILDESLYISELGVAFKNDTHQDLAKKMTQILKEMQDDGTLRDMVEKYGLDAEKALGVTNAE